MHSFLRSSQRASGLGQWVLLVLVWLTLSLSTQAQSRRYVKPSASGDGSGVSWADASGNLQAMIDAPGVEQVWVAAGSYTRTGGGSFSMKNKVGIYGGFAGSETSLESRPPVNPVAGQPSTTTLTVSSAVGVIVNQRLTNTAILDGVVITGGNVTNPSAGGGMYNSSSSPSLINCSFQNNTAEAGGGMFNISSSSPSLINCSFRDNTASSGGGGMFNLSSSNPSLINCSFENNTAQTGGGMNNLASRPSLINCSFRGNSASRSSGGIFINGDSTSLINCSFENNTAQSDGGGLYIFGGSSSLINCSFQNNTAQSGGGMVTNSTNASLTNCSLQANTANEGGGIYNNGGSPALTNCVLFNNGGANTLVNVEGGSLRASYSLFDDTVTGFTDGGNNLRTRVSPFQNTTGPQLSICAPAIDAGDNAANTTTTDVLGNARKVRTIDMGAAEFQGAAYVAPALSTISQSATDVCAGTFVSFTLYATGGSQGIKAGSLYRGNTNLGDADVSVAPGSAFRFTRAFPLHRSGTYQIVVTSQCTSLTTTFAPITVNPLPAQYAVTGGGTYCQGSMAPAVGLSGSQMDVTYQLLRGKTPVGDPVAGTGSAISFGNQTGEGTFTVLATNVSTSCQRTMSGSQSVTEKPTPAAPTLITQSGGPYPAGVSSLTIAQSTGNDILMVSGCQDGTLTWNGGSNSTLAVSTANLGTQSFTATCTSNGCTSPTATATVTVVAPTLKVLSRDPDNNQLGNNTIKPYLLLQNAGATPIPYSSITLRYWLTTENSIPLLFQKNYVAIGQGNLNLRYVPLSPTRQGATGYIEYSFNAGAGSLAPNGDSGPLEVQASKQDYSRFVQSDDYSYINNSAFTLNSRITAYQNGTIFYGVEPSGAGSSREAAEEPGSLLLVKVLGNPVVGQSAEVEISGVAGQAVELKLIDMQGKTVYGHSIKGVRSVERVSLPLGNAQGLLLLEVSTTTQRQQVKLLRP